MESLSFLSPFMPTSADIDAFIQEMQEYSPRTDLILPKTIDSTRFASLYPTLPGSSEISEITPALFFEAFGSFSSGTPRAFDDSWMSDSTNTPFHPLPGDINFGQIYTSRVTGTPVTGSSLPGVSALLDFESLATSTPSRPTLSLSTIHTFPSFQLDPLPQTKTGSSIHELSLSKHFTIINHEPVSQTSKSPPFNTTLSLSAVITFMDSKPTSPAIMNTRAKTALSFSEVSAILSFEPVSPVVISMPSRIALSFSRVRTTLNIKPLSPDIMSQLSRTALPLPETHIVKDLGPRPFTTAPQTPSKLCVSNITDASRQKGGKLRKIRKPTSFGHHLQDRSPQAKRLVGDYKAKKDPSATSAHVNTTKHTTSNQLLSVADTPVLTAGPCQIPAQEPLASGGDSRKRKHQTSGLRGAGNSKSGSSAMNAIVIDEPPYETPKREPDVSIGPQPILPQTPTRQRTSPKTALGVVMWSDPKVEEQCLTQTNSLYYEIQGQWMSVRQCEGFIGTGAMENFDKLINAVVQKALANEAVSYEDSIRLHDDYANVTRKALRKLEVESDKELVRNLGGLIAQVCDSSYMAELIWSHPMANDEHDADYTPGSDVAGSHKSSKRRRIQEIR